MEHIECLITGAKDLYPLKGFEKHYLVKSKSSRFVFASKIPTSKELEEYYSGYQRIDLYVSDLTIKRYNEILDQFERFRQTNNLIDVGCGSGHFLVVAKKRGWNVYGTEFTDEAIKVCEEKGIKMTKGVLDKTLFESSFFDVITSFEVIEHINNPVKEISNMNYILRKGGAIYITTPNFNAFERHILGADYNVLCYPEHLSYYTAKTLNKLLNNNGFKKVFLTTTGISLTRIKKSSGISDEQLISKESTDEVLRNKLEENIVLNFAKTLVNKILSITRMGNAIKALYIKNE